MGTFFTFVVHIGSLFSVFQSRCFRKIDTVSQVERWLRLRRRLGLPSKLQKFQETGWRWFWYLSSCICSTTNICNFQMFFSDNNLGGCSTYLPSSMESVVSGKSPGSAASIIAGKDTRITRWKLQSGFWLVFWLWSLPVSQGEYCKTVSGWSIGWEGYPYHKVKISKQFLVGQLVGKATCITSWK